MIFSTHILVRITALLHSLRISLLFLSCHLHNFSIQLENLFYNYTLLSYLFDVLFMALLSQPQTDSRETCLSRPLINGLRFFKLASQPSIYN